MIPKGWREVDPAEGFREGDALLLETGAPSLGWSARHLELLAKRGKMVIRRLGPPIDTPRTALVKSSTRPFLCSPSSAWEQ